MTGIIFAGIFVAFSGGFLLPWAYGQDWFLELPTAKTPERLNLLPFRPVWTRGKPYCFDTISL